MCLPYIQLEDHNLASFTWYVHFPLTGLVLKGPPKTPNEIYSTAIRELNRRKHSVWTTPCDKIKLTGGMAITIQAPLNNKKLFRQAVEKELWLQLRRCLDTDFSVESHAGEAVSKVGDEYTDEERERADAKVSALTAIYRDTAEWLDEHSQGQ
ncbi:hypothetical protein BJX96DRAFT_178663 [Aspergillus floccosus]